MHWSENREKSARVGQEHRREHEKMVWRLGLPGGTRLLTGAPALVARENRAQVSHHVILATHRVSLFCCWRSCTQPPHAHGGRMTMRLGETETVSYSARNGHHEV